MNQEGNQGLQALVWWLRMEVSIIDIKAKKDTQQKKQTNLTPAKDMFRIKENFCTHNFDHSLLIQKKVIKIVCTKVFFNSKHIF